jgi:SAM-dependent methyltransferase
MATTIREPSSRSFRDPDGCVIAADGRILRIASASGLRAVEDLGESFCFRDLQQQHSIPGMEVLDESSVRDLRGSSYFDRVYRNAGGCAVIEHTPVSFQSFPCEWPVEMLHAAGELTLDIAERLLKEGRGLKDANPWNIQFEGPRPVFVDVFSIEPRDPFDPIWLAHDQFVRTFLLPLYAASQLGIDPRRTLDGTADGLEPATVLRWAGLLRGLAPGVFRYVTLPGLLSRYSSPSGSFYQGRRVSDPGQAVFTLKRAIRALRRALRRFAPRELRASSWSEYMTKECIYAPVQFQQKQGFVLEALREFRPGAILDLGCNTGFFSLEAARIAKAVVAVDSDPVAVGQCWRQASYHGLPVLPLVVGLSQPTPAAGWRNRERPSFLDRARGRFDAVLMLAVLHHLLVTDRVPLEEIIELLAELSRDLVVVEYVGPADPNFQRIVRGRQALHEGLSSAAFENACAARFHIVRTMPIEGMDRRMYLLRRKES